jgi:hypothetical protein
MVRCHAVVLRDSAPVGPLSASSDRYYVAAVMHGAQIRAGRGSTDGVMCGEERGGVAGVPVAFLRFALAQAKERAHERDSRGRL